MEIGLVGVVAVVLIVGVAMVSGRIGIAAPLVLVVLGIGIGYLPWVPLVELDPEIILIGVLPPLLYSAAVNVPLVDLRRNLGPITGLSVVLVLISAVLVGLLITWILPEVPLAAGIALGAVVSPTDAVAATSIGKRLGLPPRLVTILEGESLVNDATALVLLRAAVAAVAGGFAFAEVSLEFLYAAALAILIGVLVGAVTVWLRSKITNPVHDTVISFIVPFVAFLPTEEIGASGVLAVVVAGLYSGHVGAKHFSAKARMNERLNWRTIQFVLENAVFLVMGLQLHALTDQLNENEVTIWHMALIGIAVSALLIVSRGLFMIPVVLILRFQLRRREARMAGLNGFADRVRDADPAQIEDERMRKRLRFADRWLRKRQADLDHAQQQGLGWRGGAVLAWSGMRGVVTLAAAQSLPSDFPYRAPLILIAFFVAVITLLLHGTTLPPLIRRLTIVGPSRDDSARELRSLSQDLLDEGLNALEESLREQSELADEDHRVDYPNEEVVDRVRASARNTLAPLILSLPQAVVSAEEPERPETAAEQYVRLSHVVLEAQRAALLEERAIGRYSSASIRAAEHLLDSQETRLHPK
ncbi:cation:proton antiporter [Leucobacter sp. M11]|uniref:cation:proton antiporter n=1 Tax=Leucobacter sp. M11 TaxID=2993565 RepID=UPI002D7E9E73|nr:sodium:proton antiporter [Leucobacter sp. M11]MEB4613333.1 sodium:proton antiporter [Leucobacter sp. M11]